MKSIILALCGALSLGACANEPIAVSHELVTKDRSHWAVQISMHSGVAGSPVQTVMIVYNKFSKKPQAIVSGNSLTLSDQLFQAILNLGPAIVTGNYILKAAKIECPAGTLCGTLVQVTNQAGANAAAGAEVNGS